MKRMFIIKPGLCRLPQEHILHSVQVKRLPLNKTSVFKLLAIPIMWLNKTQQINLIPV